jgi:gliding motility-associated-like protein
LNFYSNSSVCIEVLSCPNTINTLQPVVTMGGDSVCVGSVIDVPFYSTGVFQTNNVYIAELSDATGNFPPNPNVLGSSPDANSYDPALGSPPGSVSGLINENNHPITDGCNYYIRIRSTNPATIGMVWGPFCIRHCDIETNYKMDIQACISSTHGFDTTVFVDINYYDSLAIYGTPNQFLLEVHESQFFNIVNVGGLGSVVANNDTTMTITIPPTPGLGALGLQPGLYYVRVIATNSNHTYDLLGTLIRLIIGAPADNLYIFQTPPDSVLCVGDAVYFYPIPYNAGPPMNSTYVWHLNGVVFSTNPSLGILFNGAGIYNLTVQETNYGCLGPVVPNSVSFEVLGPPTAGIIGPTQVCLGDTIYYHTIFNPNVYYEWTSTGGIIIDTSNNELYILFDTEGIFTVNLLTLNKCGQKIGVKNIIVTAHPDPHFTVTSPVCTGDASIVMYTGITTPPLNFAWNWDGGNATPGGNNAGPHSVYWNTPGTHPVIITVTKYSCPSKDTMNVVVLPGPVPAFTFDQQCSGIPIYFSDSSQGNPIQWSWNFGDGSPIDTSINPVHTFVNGGTYWITLAEISANGCTDTIWQEFIVNPSASSAFITESPVCNGINSIVTYAGSGTPNATYTWNFGTGTVVSGEGQGPYEISWPAIGDYNISLIVAENGCSSTSNDSVKVNGCVIEIPNIFTPNGDGINDVFFIKGLESFPDSKLEINNRWGKMIYKNANYKNDWKGDDHADGVYYYVLILKNGQQYSGTITLMR